MAIREIVWTVLENGQTIHPTAPQDGGVQGEHNATRAVWRVGENSVWETPTFKVYVECEDNAGNVDHTVPLQVVGGQISVLLPQAWTQYGGISILRLVAEEEDGVVAYLVEGYARFSSRQNASKKVDGLMKGRLAKMEARMQGAVDDATSAAEDAAAAAEAAVVAKGGAENAAQSASISREGAQHFAEQAAGAASAAGNSATAAATAAEEAKKAASEVGSTAEALGKAEERLTELERKTSLVVRFTSTDGGKTVVSDKTFADCIAASNAGVTVFGEYNDGEAYLCGVMTMTYYTDKEGAVYFEMRDELCTSVIHILMYEDNSCVVNTQSDLDAIVNGEGEYGITKLATEKYVRGKMLNFGLYLENVEGMVVTNKKKLSDLRIVNVRDHGAVGDGVTDDTEAIQAALHYAEDNGLPLYIPAGNYLVSKTISTYTRDTEADKQSKTINIFGSGMSTVFTTAPNFEGDFVLYIDAKGVQPRMVWIHDFAFDLTVDVSGIYFREIGMKSVVENLWITFKYLKKETDTTVRSAIFCDNSVVSTFQRIKVQGNISGLAENLTKNCGIVLREQTTTHIVDCDIIFCGWAIYLGGGSIGVIENCRIDENDYGVFQYTAPTDIDPAPRAYTKSPVTGEGFGSCVANLTIARNRFEGNNCVSIFMMSYATGNNNYLCNKGVVIADNYFTGLGAGTAMWQPDRAVFRKAMRFARCVGLSIERNVFNGKPYDSTNIDSREQNYSGDLYVDDVSFRGNVVPPYLTGEKFEDGTAIAVDGNKSLPLYFCAYKGYVNNIEANQSTRQDISLRRTMPINVTASGTVDASNASLFVLSDGVYVDTINLESGADSSASQEITFVAVGASATIKSTNRIKLAGGVDFVMGEFDTITFERVYIYPRGNFWVEKSRSVNSVT